MSHNNKRIHLTPTGLLMEGDYTSLHRLFAKMLAQVRWGFYASQRKRCGVSVRSIPHILSLQFQSGSRWNLTCPTTNDYRPTSV